VRIDRWLWAARFYKSRSLAADAVAGGRVHLNGERVKPAKEVRVEDRLEVTMGVERRQVIVTGLAERRGSATVAATLYRETADSLERRTQQALGRRLAQPLGADLGARPTKQARRRLDAFRRRRS
jgi:ribosome-associated heat shock protein Hsp15